MEDLTYSVNVYENDLGIYIFIGHNILRFDSMEELEKFIKQTQKIAADIKEKHHEKV